MTTSNNANNKKGVQAGLTESTFAKYLEGYSQVVPQDLLEAKGGSVRYAIDSKSGKTQYRLGGTLTAVDPSMRFIRLLNPYARNRNGGHRGVTWSVQLDQGQDRLRLWYMPPSSRDEIIMFRKLLQQLERGEIKIVKVGSS